MAKRILILGITGSIGTQALDCLDGLELVGCSFGNNIGKMQAIKARFPNLYIYSPNTTELNNVASMEELFIKAKPDLVLNAVVGWEGLAATRFCVEHGYPLALANKESLVIAGFLIRDYPILPVDSEHSSLHELMQIEPNKVKTIYITASGGPFYQIPKAERFAKQFSEAVKHPKWTMGAKISVDSATLVNKCFELIEAHHLFPNAAIKALYHPQAVVHSMVEFENNSLLANMSAPDMRLSIDLALHDFQRRPAKIQPLSFKDLTLTFAEIDPEEWLPLQWAEEVIKTDNHAIGIIVNTVNEWTFREFQAGRIVFGMIPLIINEYVEKYRNFPVADFTDLEKLHEMILHDLGVA